MLSPLPLLLPVTPVTQLLLLRLLFMLASMLHVEPKLPLMPVKPSEEPLPKISPEDPANRLLHCQSLQLAMAGGRVDCTKGMLKLTKNQI